MVISFNGEGKQVSPTRKNTSLSFSFRATERMIPMAKEEVAPLRCEEGKGKSLDLPRVLFCQILARAVHA